MVVVMPCLIDIYNKTLVLFAAEPGIQTGQPALLQQPTDFSGHVTGKTTLFFSTGQPAHQKQVFLGFGVNMTILAGKMQGYQGTPGQVGASGCLF